MYIYELRTCNYGSSPGNHKEANGYGTDRAGAEADDERAPQRNTAQLKHCKQVISDIYIASVTGGDRRSICRET